MPSDNELLAKFKRLSDENIEILEEKVALERIAARGSIADLNVKRQAILSISTMLEGVRTGRDFDAEIAFLRQNVCARLEENEMSISEIILEMISSSNPVCQKVASAYTRSNGNLTATLIAYLTEKVEKIEVKAGVFPGTNGRSR